MGTERKHLNEFMSTKPDNKARRVLRNIGVIVFRLGLARLVISLSPRSLRAMLYHDVDDDPGSTIDGLNITVNQITFATHLDYFKRYYKVIPMSDVEKGKIPHRGLVITFDDGYLSVCEKATPLLHERGLPACVYLIGRAVNGRMVWVNLLNHAIKTYPDETRQALSDIEPLNNLPFEEIVLHVQVNFTPSQIEALCEHLLQTIPNLTETTEGVFATPDNIRHMQSQGIEFGFHTQDHFNLKNCTEAELAQQLDDSEVRTLTDTNTFAYPFGYFTDGAVASLTELGYERIMTVGNNNRRFSRLHLDRTEVFSSDPAVLFAELEVVEPVITVIRKIASLFRSERSTLANEVVADVQSNDLPDAPSRDKTPQTQNRAA